MYVTGNIRFKLSFFTINHDIMLKLLLFLIQASDFCHFSSPHPLAVGDIENQILNVDFRVSVGMHTNPHFITASTTVTVDSFSFIFLAFIDKNNDSFVLGVSLYIQWVINPVHISAV